MAETGMEIENSTGWEWQLNITDSFGTIFFMAELILLLVIQGIDNVKFDNVFIRANFWHM